MKKTIIELQNECQNACVENQKFEILQKEECNRIYGGNASDIIIVDLDIV